MIRIVRTDASNSDFAGLVRMLDTEVALRYPDDHDLFAPYNKIESIPYVVLIYSDEVAIACGAMKSFDSRTMEIKRMYVSEKGRKKGLASMILLELEKWAMELNCTRCVLETGRRQPEAIGLYEKLGYVLMDNYAPYVGAKNRICFEKKLA